MKKLLFGLSLILISSIGFSQTIETIYKGSNRPNTIQADTDDQAWDKVNANDAALKATIVTGSPATVDSLAKHLDTLQVHNTRLTAIEGDTAIWTNMLQDSLGWFIVDAVMDGYTDNTVAFQAAIDAAYNSIDSSYAVVYIPPGVMAIDIGDKSAITPRDSVIIRGAGKDATIIKCTPTSIGDYTTNGILFDFGTTYNAVIEDLTISGAYTNAGSQTELLYAFANTGGGNGFINIKGTNVRFTGFSYPIKIATGDSSRIELQFCDFEYCKMGIQSSDTSEDTSEVIVNHCVFNHIGYSGGAGLPDHSIYVYGGVASRVTNCTFDNQYDSYAYDIAGTGEASALYRIIDNCVFDNLDVGAIDTQYDLDSPITPVVISNCVFKGGTGTGIYTYDGTVIVDNCTFDVGSAIIYSGTNDTTYLTMTNSVINLTEADSYGVHFASNFSNANITNTVFRGNNTTTQYAIYAASDSLELVIDNCEFIDTFQCALLLRGSINRGVITNNLFDVQDEAIVLQPYAGKTMNLTIADNYVKNCDQFIFEEGGSSTTTLNLTRARNTIISGTPYYQWTDAASTRNFSFYNNYVTKKYIIGVNAQTLCDFNFSNDADSDEENIDLGTIVPAKANVVKVDLVCLTTLAGSGSHDIVIGVGNASSGEQYIAAASIDDANEVLGSTAVLTDAVDMNWSSATDVWIQGNPDANWSTYTAGKWAVYVTYCLYEL